MYTSPSDPDEPGKKELRKMESEQKWFATRVFSSRAYVFKYLEMYGFRTTRIDAVPSLLFIYTDVHTLQKLRFGDLLGHIMVYRKADSNEPDPVPEHSVKTLKLLAPFKSGEVSYMAVDDPTFFDGPRKRVIQGIFVGMEGVIKRIRGHRRLVVRISAKAAIVTTYIPREHLEDIR